MSLRFFIATLFLFPLLAVARTYEIRDVQIDYQPVLTVSYLPTGDASIASLEPEFVFEFVPEKETETHSVGSIRATLYLHGTIDLLKTTYPQQVEHALQIFEEQSVDAAILLRNKFGGRLSRVGGIQFEEPESFLVDVLDNWNVYWNKSREMWKPYLDALSTEQFPTFEKNYVRSFRYHHFGEAVAVSG
ncbi:MAG: hypothetical protein ABQ298_11435 [Puniceicoccaceae bacterium]